MKPYSVKICFLTPISCAACNNCPDLFELPDGDFVVIGLDVTRELASDLPPGAGCGPDERIVRIPRAVLVHARPEIPVSV